MERGHPSDASDRRTRVQRKTKDGIRRPRRALEPDQRKRDPARTRRLILDAARLEFGEKGYAGARVSEIAARAGVNMQLISYYFGGKSGLYEAVTRAWATLSSDLNRPDLPLAELVAAFLQASIGNRSETRLLAWQGLSDDPDRPEAPEEVELMRAMVADLRRRQAEGELADDLDPAAVLLAFFGAVAVPTILPQIARRIYGDADSATFFEDYAEQLRRLVRHLEPR
jgi:TetR/AcrR family transcriptional regulator